MPPSHVAAADSPRVLVLLAAYNGEAWIEAQLTSVLRQDGVRVDVLVSDDHSSDGTLARVRAVAADDARVRVLAKATSSGSAAANFIGLVDTAEADGFTHVALCDQDDIWHEYKLAAACRRLAEENAALYSSATIAFWPDGRRTLLAQASLQTSTDYLFEGAGQGCTFVATASLFASIQTFVRSHRSLLAPVHYHDWLFYALTRVWGRRWTYDSHAHLEYRQHAGNDTGARASAGGLLRRLSLIRSGWYAGQVRSMVAICLAADNDAAEVHDVERLMASSSRSLASKGSWCRYLLTKSRRRFRDRLVLSVSAALGCL